MTTTTATHMTTVPCFRCSGAKFFEKFGHIVGGRCFRCGGAGTMQVATWKLNEQHAISAATAAKEKARWSAEQAARPYIVAVDGMECISSTFATWEAAHAWAVRLDCNDDGDAFRVAKFDGDAYRYRDGARVRFHRESVLSR